MMTLKKSKITKNTFFHLPTKDRQYFEMEENEQKAKDAAVEKVFKKLNEKNSKKR